MIVCLYLSLLLLITGCQNNTHQPEQEKYNSYLSYYQSILDSDIEMSSSQCYDIALVVNKLDEQQYRYDVIIDNSGSLEELAYKAKEFVDILFH